jgi:acyl-CoA thioesterase
MMREGPGPGPSLASGSSRHRMAGSVPPMDWTPAGLLAADAVAQDLGVELAATDPLTLALTVTERHTNFLGVTHGGVTYTLADIALSLASNAGGTRSLMVDSHLVATGGSSPGDRLTAVVTPITEGRTLASYGIEVRRSDGRIVGSFTGTVLRRPA